MAAALRKLKRAAAISRNDIIQSSQIPAFAANGFGAGASGQAAATSARLRWALKRCSEHILRVLRQSEGNRERAAAILGISSRTLYRKLREYEHERGIDRLATER